MSNLKYDGVIFDLDGVIVDTAKYHFLAWKKLADRLDINFTKEDNERLKGVSRMASLEIILEIGGKDFPLEEKKRLTDIKNEWYLEYVNQMDASEILPGSLDVINKLKELGVKIAIGSASRNAPTILKRVGLEKEFDYIADGNKVSKAKPDPEVFELAADELGVAYDRCIVFEDSEAGIEAANKLNMLSIGVGAQENLPASDMIIKDLSEFDIQKVMFE
jgi:beta-phosphoglucomutase